MTPAAALSSSRNFLRGYELCTGNGLPAENGIPNAIVPGIVCLAFSVELAIKSRSFEEHHCHRAAARRCRARKVSTVMPNRSIERTLQRPLRALWSALMSSVGPRQLLKRHA
jgi:hypothetical protein